MRSWKRRTRAQHRARLKAWRLSDSTHNRKSKYVASRIRRGIEPWSPADYNAWEAWWSPIWRKSDYLRYKHDERHVKEGMALFAKFPYYEDCRYHVCKPTRITPHEPAHGRIDVEGKSLINGSSSGCSYEHCGITHLTKEEGEERAQFAITHGMLPYQLRWIWSTENLSTADVVNIIRVHIYQDNEWGFNKNGGTQRLTELGKRWINDTFNIVLDDLAPMSQEEFEKAYP